MKQPEPEEEYVLTPVDRRHADINIPENLLKLDENDIDILHHRKNHGSSVERLDYDSMINPKAKYLFKNIRPGS